MLRLKLDERIREAGVGEASFDIESALAAPEVALLRSNHAGFLLEVVACAFRESDLLCSEHHFMEVLEVVLERRRRRQGADGYRREARDYFDAWTRAQPDAPAWFGRETDPGQGRLVRLLPHTRTAFTFLSLRDQQKTRLGESQFGEFVAFTEATAPRLMRDEAAELERLRAERERLDDRIREVEALGLEPLGPEETAAVSERIRDLVARLKDTFGAIPAELAALNAEIKDRYLHAEGTRGEILHEMLTLTARKKASGSYAMLRSLERLYQNTGRRIALEAALDGVVDHLERHFREAGDVSSLRRANEAREARGILKRLISVAGAILEQNKQIDDAHRGFIENPDFLEMRRTAVALTEALEVIREIRDVIRPGPRAKGLEEIGLEIGGVYEVPRGFDVRLALQPPESATGAANADVAAPEDQERAARRTVEEARKGRRIGDEMTDHRIDLSIAKRGGAASLSEILEDHPPEYGAEEVAAYLIAAGRRPSLFKGVEVADATVSAQREEGIASARIRCPDPFFLVGGEPAMGLPAYLRRAEAAGLWDVTRFLRRARAETRAGETRADDDLTGAAERCPR